MTRAFTTEPIDPALIDELLDTARRARRRASPRASTSSCSAGRAATRQEDREGHRRGVPARPAQLVHLQLPADHPAGGAFPLADELHAGRRIAGDELRQVQGQADHQGHSEDDVRGRGRLRRGDRGARRDQGVPAGTGEVPGGRARRSPRACCSTASPVPARRCWPARSPARPACRSTRSPVRTSSRCSSVSVPPGSATCSSRPRRTPRRSSSSTRSTPSAGTAVRASAAATTSASRR